MAGGGVTSPELVTIKRREFIRLGFGFIGTVVVGDALAACASSAMGTTAQPETTSIRLTLGACDLPIMAAERNLRNEGFTDVQFSDSGPLAALTGGEADLGAMFTATLALAVDAGKPLVGLGSLHTGCVQVWAPQSIATLKDLRGRTIVVPSKARDDVASTRDPRALTPYAFLAIGLENAGVDPGSVNFVVEPDADLTQLFVDGKSDALFLATTEAFAFQTNPANKGHIVLDQAMDAPWSLENCCVLTTTTNWAKANPVAAKRALRAIYRAADAIPPDRADIAKVATDRGLFGGAQNAALVRGAANMVPYDWRNYDAAESMRFHAKLLDEIRLLQMTPDDSVTKALDLRFSRELQSEIKR